jgi:hypothetical protein
MSGRTIFLSRLIGLYLVLISLVMAVHKQSTLESMNALVHNPPVLFVVSVIAMAAGLAMVLGHNVWSGGVPQVVVTLTGWVLLIKSVLLLFWSSDAVSRFLIVGLHYELWFFWYTAIVLLLGVYLTYAGFRSTTR